MKLKLIFFCVVLLFKPAVPEAQPRVVSMDEAIRFALKNNSGLRSTALEVDVEMQRKKASTEIPKTQVMLMVGQINSVLIDNNVQISQTIPFPTVFTSQSKLGELRVQSSKYKKASSENELVFQVKQVYLNLLYLQSQQNLLYRQDSLFSMLVEHAALRYKTGEATLLQKTGVETQYKEVQNLLHENASDQLTNSNQLRILMGEQQEVIAAYQALQPLTTTLVDDVDQITNNPQLEYRRSLTSVAFQEKRVEANNALPELSFGYFNQNLTGYHQQADGTNPYFSPGYRFNGFMVGVSVPIWFIPNNARIKSSTLRATSTRLNTDYYEKQLSGEWQKAVQQFHKQQRSLDYYKQSALPNAELILHQSQKAYDAGEIGQADYRLNLQQVLSIEESYLKTLLQYNYCIITLEFLSGKYSPN